MVKVPKVLKTKIASFRGTTGIRVANGQLSSFSRIVGRKYIDEVIPLPQEEQFGVNDCPVKHDDSEEMAKHSIYWQAHDGSHGWCCDKCGYVIQWG